MEEELSPQKRAAITRAKNKSKKYTNVYGSAIFCAKGRCQPNDSIELTADEVKAFGKMVEAC